MMIPRWMHHVRALLGGYLWVPCAHCGYMFGGHEWDTEGPHLGSVPNEAGHRALCRVCVRSGVGCRAWAARGQVHVECEFLPSLPDRYGVAEMIEYYRRRHLLTPGERLIVRIPPRWLP
jgi:hypothetical protein